MKAYIGTLEEIKENVLSYPNIEKVGKIMVISEELITHQWCIYYKTSDGVNLQNINLKEKLLDEIYEVMKDR
ncbi:hypothetical protein LJB88_04985 [Erysipelotrichaceae bacterium OttesenSCG-928-M19]|nr:hypothetical protein [Erysipelotrichaceae bacterium OttesenSCG-928-M19]